MASLSTECSEWDVEKREQPRLWMKQRWANNSVFEYYSNTWGRILVFVFVFGWLFETEYYSYSYLGFFWILYIFCWALILLMSGPQPLINRHIKICHRTFSFLMTGSTNPMKKWVGECFSLSTRRCQNWWEIEATLSWCKSQTSFYGEVGFGICLKPRNFFFKFFRGFDFLFGVWNSNSKSHISKEGCLRLTPQQSCFNLPPVWFQENLRQNNINRERVTVVNLKRKQMRGGGWRN